jgi:hypothetical protein
MKYYVLRFQAHCLIDNLCCCFAELCEECCEIRRVKDFNSSFIYDKAPVFIRRVTELNLTIEHEADYSSVAPNDNNLSTQPTDDCFIDILDANDQVCMMRFERIHT